MEGRTDRKAYMTKITVPFAIWKTRPKKKAPNEKGGGSTPASVLTRWKMMTAK